VSLSFIEFTIETALGVDEDDDNDDDDDDADDDKVIVITIIIDNNNQLIKQIHRFTFLTLPIS